jgi:hypothetical protein
MRRGSLALLGVALAAVGCAPATSSAAPPTTPLPSEAPTQPAMTASPSTAALPSGATPTSGTGRRSWQPAAEMIDERHGFDAVVLGSGDVLAVGSDLDCAPGGAQPGSERADAFDPGADAWSVVESLNKPRKNPATVVLRNGSALVLGGVNPDDVPYSSTKVFDDVARSWGDGPQLEYARERPAAVTLDDGRVLVVSEDGASDGVMTAELSDPALTEWSPVRSPPSFVSVFDLVALPDGRALGLGTDGRDSDPAPAALVYDATADTWTEVEGLARFGAAYLALADGTVLAIGGSGGGELWGDTRAAVQDAASFDPATGRWTPVASMSTARFGHQSTVLTDGRVLVAGGITVEPSSGEPLPIGSTELYDPSTDTWTTVGDLHEPRSAGLLVPLLDGSALILGGTAEVDAGVDVPFCPAPLLTVERFWP